MLPKFSIDASLLTMTFCSAMRRAPWERLMLMMAAPILIGGSEEQKNTYVRDIATGARRASFGLSEPQAGSDLKGMRTRAVRDGADWVITGSKCWMSGLAQADFYTVFARTGGDGFSCFIVERNLPGVSVARVDDKLGVRGVNTGERRLDGVRVPDSALVGVADQAFKLAMMSLNSMRP